MVPWWPGATKASHQIAIFQVEERELDTSKVSKAMSEINSSQKAAQEAKRQRWEHLACVHAHPVQQAVAEQPAHVAGKRSWLR